MSGQLHDPAALPPRNVPGIHCIRGCVDLRAGLERKIACYCREWNTDSLVVQPVAHRYSDRAIDQNILKCITTVRVQPTT
jgi:hypothetical protein